MVPSGALYEQEGKAQESAGRVRQMNEQPVMEWMVCCFFRAHFSLKLTYTFNRAHRRNLGHEGVDVRSRVLKIQLCRLVIRCMHFAFSLLSPRLSLFSSLHCRYY